MGPRSNGSDADGRVARALIDRWIEATTARDAVAYADLFLRDPDPFVAWPGGDVSRGWSAIHDHALRELYHAKTVVRSVDVEDLHVVRLTDDALYVTFQYIVQAHDLWGTSLSLKRLATWTLLHTKDGPRVAAAHFSAR